jgi:hypothetical protein
LIKLVFSFFAFWFILASCSNDNEDQFDCEVKFEIINNNDTNLFEIGAYDSDTVFIFQDNSEEKSFFEYDSETNILSISVKVFNTENIDSEFYLYLNHLDKDTLTINYERDPTIPCSGGLVLNGINYNGSFLTKQGDIYYIEK